MVRVFWVVALFFVCKMMGCIVGKVSVNRWPFGVECLVKSLNVYVEPFVGRFICLWVAVNYRCYICRRKHEQSRICPCFFQASR